MKKSKCIVLTLILIVIILASVSFGSADITIADTFRIIGNKMPFVSNLPFIGKLFDVSDIKTNYQLIVLNVRLPRILLAALVGGALSIVGANFQGVFRNPLADPHILGVSSGAAVGATIAIIIAETTGFATNLLGLGTVGVFAFVGALLTVFAVYNIAKYAGEISTFSMLLTGTATSTFLSAIISLIMTFNKKKIEKVYMWTLGSFSAANWQKVLFMVFFDVVGVTILCLLARKLNILMLGEDDAKCLGIDTDKLRKIIIVSASVLVAAAVSVSGVIGFVGLIIPHCVRLIDGADNRRLIPTSFLIGASFMVVCDTIARTVAAPTEIPVGIITALCGAPFFIWLVWKR